MAMNMYKLGEQLVFVWLVIYYYCYTMCFYCNLGLLLIFTCIFVVFY